MKAFATRVLSVEKHPNADRLTLVTVCGEGYGLTNGEAAEATHVVVANLDDEGKPRWTEGERVVYIKEGAVLPEDVLKARGYWDEENGRGFLGGDEHNTVEARKIRGVESRGLLFKVHEDYTINLYLEHGDSRLPLSGPYGADADEIAAFHGLS